MMLSAAKEPALRAESGDRLLRNVVFLGGSLVVTSILTTVWTLFVPRRIGPHGMGLIVMAWSATNIFQAVGSFGMRTLLMREIAADLRRAPELLGSALIVRFASIVPFVGMTALYVRLGRFGGQQTLVLYLATGVAVCLLLMDPFMAAFQAIQRMKYLAYADVFNKSLLSVLGIGLVLSGFGATTLVALMLVAAALVLGLYVFWSRRYFTIEWQIDLARLASLVRASLPYWGYALFSMFYLWVDSAMLAVMVPTEVVGWYGGPTKLLGSLMFVPLILSTAWLPRLVAAFGESPERLKAVARLPTEQIMVLSLPVTVGAALVASPLIRFLYGPAYAESVPVFVILTLSITPTYFNWAAYQILVACKRQATWTRALAVASVVNPLLNLFLITAFQRRMGNGAIGAALSFLLTELLLVGVGAVVVRPYLHREILTGLGRSALATLGMGGVVVLVHPLGLGPQVIAGVVTFLLLGLLLRVLSDDEERQIKELLRRFRMRLLGHGPVDSGRRSA
ncbi:MAG TPA: flippase [Candidatus Sulfotelmatobacter sp.]|nr:flippase [Candidatus Sulfotelmatobacter sp.]